MMIDSYLDDHRYAAKGAVTQSDQIVRRDAAGYSDPDRRGARGDMAMGVGLRPTTKAVEEPPNPTARAPRIYPDSCVFMR
jgi:hypothetical protein